MIDWYAIDVEELQILAAVATRYNLGIAAMIRNLNVLSEEECSLVVSILKQGVVVVSAKSGQIFGRRVINRREE